MKKYISVILTGAVLLSLAGCGGNKPAETTTTEAETTAATTTTTTAAETTTTTAATTTTEATTTTTTASETDPKEAEPTDTGDGESRGDFDAKLVTTKDRWTRLYLKEGEEDRNSYWPYITVEYNREKDYVAFTMDYLGSNIYMSVDSADLVPIDGEYWIQDFGNADGSPPELTKAYMKYTPEQIIIYYWSEIDQAFSWDYPQKFNFTEEF